MKNEVDRLTEAIDVFEVQLLALIKEPKLLDEMYCGGDTIDRTFLHLTMLRSELEHFPDAFPQFSDSPS